MSSLTTPGDPKHHLAQQDEREDIFNAAEF